MEWSDDALIISTRRHGETSMIASLLSREHGRYAGLVRGGAGKYKRGIMQPGNLVRAQWRARLPEHLGSFTCEMTRSLAADAMGNPLHLMALSSACSVCVTVLPEREPHQSIFDGLLILLENLCVEDWPSLYVKWEMGLLGELGFGLDLSACASTGSDQDLAYISPKSGRAVSKSAGAPYKDRLLTLPPFLLDPARAATSMAEIADGLRLTGFFLNRHAFPENNRENAHSQPDARSRFVQALSSKTIQDL